MTQTISRGTSLYLSQKSQKSQIELLEGDGLADSADSADDAVVQSVNDI